MIPSKLFVEATKRLKSLYKISIRHSASQVKEKAPIVTIIDASTKIGRTLALLLKQSPLVGELRLYDKSNSVCSIAEDLSHIDTKTKVRSFGGRSSLKFALLDADIVVAVGGCRNSQKQTPRDLFERNVDELRLVTLHMVEFNPKAVFCLAKPPIEAMVPLVSEEYKKAGVYDSRKIIGLTSVATMRANYHIAAKTGQNASDVLCPIVGGISSHCLVGVLSQVKPDLGSNSHCHSSIHSDLGHSEDDLLKLYGDCATICMAPALAISRFINTLLRALLGDSNCVDCAFVRQTGHIGQFLPYMASIVRLGRHGILSSHMPKVNGEEGQRLKVASCIIRNLINMGESFVTGEFRPDPEKAVKCKVTEKTKDKPVLNGNENLSKVKEARIVQ